MELRDTKGTVHRALHDDVRSAGNRYQPFTGTGAAIRGTEAYAKARGGGPATRVLDFFAPENPQVEFLVDGYPPTRRVGA